MSISTKQNYTLTVPLSMPEVMPVDRALLADYLRRILAGSSDLSHIPDAIETADPHAASVSLPIRVSQKYATDVMTELLTLEDAAANHPQSNITNEELARYRRAAYGLRKFRVAWKQATGCLHALEYK